MLIFRLPIDEKTSIADESSRVTNSHDDSSPVFGIRKETAEERRISKRSKFLRPMANIRKLETKDRDFLDPNRKRSMFGRSMKFRIGRGDQKLIANPATRLLSCDFA